MTAAESACIIGQGRETAVYTKRAEGDNGSALGTYGDLVVFARLEVDPPSFSEAHDIEPRRQRTTLMTFSQLDFARCRFAPVRGHRCMTY